MQIVFILLTLFLFQVALGESMDWQQYIPQNNKGKIEYGNTHLGKETLLSLTVYGNATLDGTTITENTEINGTTDAKQSVFNKITVNGNFQGTGIQINEGLFNGSVFLKDSKVSGNLKIRGFLHAIGSDFKGEISIDSTEIVFSDSKVNYVIIENNSAHFTKQIVYLKDKTIVKGSITFHSGKGEVVVSGNSKLKESQVNGGKITKSEL